MKEKTLREWLFQHCLEDQWYVSSEGHVFQDIFTLKDVSQYVKEGVQAQIKLLHISQVEMSSPPWVDFELDSVDAKAPQASEVKPAKGVSVSRPVKTRSVVSSVAAAVPVANHQAIKPQTWRVRQSNRRRVKPTRDTQQETFWSPEKIGGAAAIVGLLLLVVGLIFSNNETEAKAPITSKDAYYASQSFIKNKFGDHVTVTFPSDRAEGVFHEELRNNLFKVHGFVRLNEDGSSRFESYNMIARHRGDKQWDLVYLKAGPILVGSIPKDLSKDEAAFVAKQ